MAGPAQITRTKDRNPGSIALGGATALWCDSMAAPGTSNGINAAVPNAGHIILPTPFKILRVCIRLGGAVTNNPSFNLVLGDGNASGAVNPIDTIESLGYYTLAPAGAQAFLTSPSLTGGANNQLLTFTPDVWDGVWPAGVMTVRLITGASDNMAAGTRVALLGKFYDVLPTHPSNQAGDVVFYPGNDLA